MRPENDKSAFGLVKLTKKDPACASAASSCFIYSPLQLAFAAGLVRYVGICMAGRLMLLDFTFFTPPNQSYHNQVRPNTD